MSELFAQCVNGIMIALGIYLIASGLSLVFGVLGVLNFAHGSFYMYGAFLTFTLSRIILGNVPGYFWLILLLVPLVIAALGVCMEMGLLRFIYHADPLYQLLLTYGIVLILSDAVKLLWGAENQTIPRPPGFEGAVSIWGQLFPRYNVYILLPCSVATMLGLVRQRGG